MQRRWPRSILIVDFVGSRGMFSMCQFSSKMSGMIRARHQIAADRRHPSVTASRAGLQGGLDRGMAGISIGPLATDTSRF